MPIVNIEDRGLSFINIYTMSYKIYSQKKELVLNIILSLIWSF